MYGYVAFYQLICIVCIISRTVKKRVIELSLEPLIINKLSFVKKYIQI